MEGGRTFVIQRRPKIIFDRRFADINKLEVGDKGQLLVTGIKEGEEMIFGSDDVERKVSTIRITSAVKLDDRKPRA